MFTNIESLLGSIRTYEVDGLKWFVAKDILMDAIGYRNMTDLLTKVDKEEKNKIPSSGGYKLTVLTSEGLRQFFDRTISSKEQFDTMRKWAIEQGCIPKEVNRSVATNLPVLGDTFDNSEFESKQDRSQTLEGNFYSSITKSYVNGLVLCGLSFSLLLIKLPVISSK
ncbi:BRO family protein [Bacillus toyonensis]|uniref:BRO family protein n=1 Tax=Bacillus toyonensis TaxID=155322 RepID=UPI002E1DAC40|nr:BRO family protein [Bacillus toyonensis]